MFEISWSELLILAAVTLIFVGPKELPVFLRTVGRYAGALRRQANEFRAHFDAAMREAELQEMRDELNAMQASVNAEVMRANPTTPEPTIRRPAVASSAPPVAATGEAAKPAQQPPMPATPGRVAATSSEPGTES